MDPGSLSRGRPRGLGAVRLGPVTDVRALAGRLRRALERRAIAVDAAFAVILLVLTLMPTSQHLRMCDCGTLPTWAYLLVLAQTLPLMWRRRAPFTVALIVGAATTAHGMVEIPDPPLPYGALLAIYTVAAYGSRRLALAAAGITAAALLFALLFAAGDTNAQDYLVNYLVFAIAWLLGDSVRSRRGRLAEAEARVANLERTREAEAARAVVEERNRIAREMHDVVAHHVSMMVVQAEAGPVGIERDPALAARAFDAISATGKQALIEMRGLLGVLRTGETAGDTPPLAPQPTIDRLADLFAQVREAGLPVEFTVAGDPIPLPSAVDLSVYRIVQESLTNALKHAGPATAIVRLTYGPDHLRIQVSDDGIGGPHPASGGHGLIGMRERIVLLGGDLSAGGRPGGGYLVDARIPTHLSVPAR